MGTFFAPNQGLDISLQRIVASASIVRTTRAFNDFGAVAGPYTLNDIDIGPADPTKIVGVISYAGVSTGTMGATGNGAAMAHPIAHASSSRLLDYFEIAQPSETLFDLVLTPTGTGSRAEAFVFTITGQAVPGYTDISGSAPAASASNTTLATGAVDLASPGIVTAGAMHNNGAAGGEMTWTPSGGTTLNDTVGSGGPWFSIWFDDALTGSINPQATHTQVADLMRALSVAHA